MLGVPPELAASYSKRIQKLVGYGLMDGSFVGYVEGRDPGKLIERLGSSPGAPRPSVAKRPGSDDGAAG
jgi:hypothetical protein